MKSMMEELVATLQSMGKMGSQVADGTTFNIDVPDAKPLTVDDFSDVKEFVIAKSTKSRL